MADEKVLTGALGIIKVGNVVVGKAKNVRCTESFRRVDVMGIGTLFLSEAPIVGFNGTCSFSQMSISFKKDGLPGAIKRIFFNIYSQAFAGVESFEDQLILDSDGIDMDIYKKVADYIDPTTGAIKPKPQIYVTVRNLLIESDGFDLSEGAVVTRDQQFRYLTPITYS
jgi:hypothetical protein